MNPETVKEIVKALQPVAEKLGQGAEHVYALAVRQAMVDGWRLIALAGFFVLYLIAYAVFLRWALVSKRIDTYEVVAFGAIVGGVFALAAFVGTGIALYHATGMLCNPEWYATQSILSAVR